MQRAYARGGEPNIASINEKAEAGQPQKLPVSEAAATIACMSDQVLIQIITVLNCAGDGLEVCGVSSIARQKAQPQVQG